MNLLRTIFLAILLSMGVWIIAHGEEWVALGGCLLGAYTAMSERKKEE